MSYCRVIGVIGLERQLSIFCATSLPDRRGNAPVSAVEKLFEPFDIVRDEKPSLGINSGKRERRRRCDFDFVLTVSNFLQPYVLAEQLRPPSAGDCFRGVTTSAKAQTRKKSRVSRLD